MSDSTIVAKRHKMDAKDKRIAELESSLRELADAIINTKGALENDLYRTRVKTAHDYLEDVSDLAQNWMTEPGE